MALGWTVYRLAQESGVAQQSIHLVERGERSMTIETAQALAQALGQSMAMFDAPPT